MNINKVLEILIEMQKWRRGEEPYDKLGVQCPYTPKEFGEAIDAAIEILSKNGNK
jgi:hypothetical protein